MLLSQSSPQSIHVDIDAVGAPAELPLFPVGTQKFIVLSTFSLGVYELYWCYQNWKRLADVSRLGLSPFWRAFFAPLWCFALFSMVRALAVEHKVKARWSAGVLGGLYFIFSVMWRLPDPWWLISFASILPMIPVQRTAQRINAAHPAAMTEDPNTTYGGANIAVIVIGTILFLFGLLGTFAAV